jgi:hypothetical protein
VLLIIIKFSTKKICGCFKKNSLVTLASVANEDEDFAGIKNNEKGVTL